MLHIDLGEQVIVTTKSGRRQGRTTFVSTKDVFVRFAAGQKAAHFDRRLTSIVPVRFIEAMAEVDEDEANAAAYRAATK